ncbi:hypothetical protein [Pelagibacterium limicola]|uniref:hypothetical protein n=1 Tax=Pelagibacterium limicola TaxID=2791022 RepID=UPI0018AF672D|nr:hypothetical protein [Pelagibacterium limicola]
MFKALGPVAIAAVLALSSVTPASTQVAAAPDFSSIRTVCSLPDAQQAACTAAILAYVASLRAQGLSAADIDVLLGQLAAALAEDSLLPGAPSGIIALALNTIAEQVSDPAQAAQLVALATAIQNGQDLPVAAIGAPTPASPN